LSQLLFHPVLSEATFATVIIPIAVPKAYTYIIPEELIDDLHFGMRVEVQFGKSKLYAGLVIDIHKNQPENYKPKPLLSIIDKQPIISKEQFSLWKWIAQYYCCMIGEVMNAALPAGLKLNSETTITLSSVFEDNFEVLNDKEYLIAEALTIQDELKIKDVQNILNQKNVYPIINKLLEKRVVFLKETLKEKYKPKKIACLRLQEPYASNSELLQEAFEKVGKAERQMEALMAFIQLDRSQDFVRKQDVYKKAQTNISVLKAMEKKGIFEFYDKEISRLNTYESELLEVTTLSDQQSNAIAAIKEQFKEKRVLLLHGVTGSGKTRVYVEMIKEVIEKGGQVLYLIPEIALTTQIIMRLEKIFGDQINVYNSRINDNKRVEVWKNVRNGTPLILGARSAMFLPYNNLQLIIVDEEHDPSYKQWDPAPRYNARDAAVYMAHLHNAKIILGTATPSIETFHNVQTNKYGLVEMPERFGGLKMPEIQLVDKKLEHKKKTMKSIFTSVLIEALTTALENEEQAILFQNRRGYAPTLRCVSCAWHLECVNCDVSMTYHKYTNNLRCHYCGHSEHIPKTCLACGSHEVIMTGFGTQKIEDEIKIYLPDARIGRMDFDTVRTKNAHAKIINDFEERRLDILVGTQMVTKGLDFDNVGVVGVLSADQLLQFPDFRASERGFQLMTQVSGRAGRKKKQGKVIIQAFDISHPVLKEVIEGDYLGFYKREVAERQAFGYPPYQRLIQITLKHKKPTTVNEAAYFYTKFLQEKLGGLVIGPAIPSIPRVRNYYLLDVLIKLGKNSKQINFAKTSVLQANQMLAQKEGYSSVRINVNVDPY
jgi:primosomal protein N' (replication factor Y)